MHYFPTTPCIEYSKKELAEYIFELYIDRGGLDALGKLKKQVGRQYTHRPYIEYFWVNFNDDREVQRWHYMRMNAQFVKSINFFLVPNQIVEDDNILDEKYNALANVSLPVID